MTKHLKIILKEMCDRVGADFEKIDFKKQVYQWTNKEEEKFKQWLIEYLKNNTDACLELTSHSKTSLKRKKRGKTGFERTADMFIMSYGWKTKGILKVYIKNG